jgi:hypothetical protein
MPERIIRVCGACVSATTSGLCHWDYTSGSRGKGALERSFGAAGTVRIDVAATRLRKIRENRKVTKWGGVSVGVVCKTNFNSRNVGINDFLKEDA